MITSILSNNEPTVNATLPTDLRALPEAEDARENIPRSGRPESSAINLVCADVGVAADPSQAASSLAPHRCRVAAMAARLCSEKASLAQWQDHNEQRGLG